MTELSTSAERTARLLADGDRVLAASSDAERRSALVNFLDKVADWLPDANAAVFGDQLQRLADRIGSDRHMDAPLSGWSKARLDARSSLRADRDSDFGRGVAAFPLRFLWLAAVEEKALLRSLFAWIGDCVGEEQKFLNLPASLRATWDIAAAGTRLRNSLIARIDKLSGEGLQWRMAAEVRSLIEDRSSLKLLFSETGRPADAKDVSSAMMAFLATTSVYQLETSDLGISIPEARGVLFPLLKAWNNFPVSSDDIAHEVGLREELADICLQQIGSARDHRDIMDVWQLASLTAPRNYSHDGDYKSLQQARAQIYDRCVRIEYANVDQQPDQTYSGRIGLLVSSLVESAETQAILAHYTGLEIAGARPVLILWPHFQLAQAEFHAQVLQLNLIDLSDLTLEDRVSAVRGCGFQCLLFMNNLTWGWSEYIAASLFRLAPIQIATYLSVVTVGFRNIDYFLVGQDSEGEEAGERYLEKLCTMTGSVLCFPESESNESGPVRAPGTAILVCGASLPKLTPEAVADHVRIAELADASKLIYYPLNPAWGNSLPAQTALAYLQRLAARYGRFPSDRIELAGPWTAQFRVIALLRHASLYLDAFPHTGGLSVFEAARMGVPLAYRSRPLQRSLQAENVAKAVGAQAINLELGFPDKAQINELIYGALAPANVNGLSDVAHFGVRLLAALESIGVGRSTHSDWTSYLKIKDLASLKIGRRTKLVANRPSNVAAWHGKLIWSAGNAAEGRGPTSGTTFFRHGAGAMIISIVASEGIGEDGPQISLRVNGTPFGWSEPFPPFPGAGQAQSFVIPARDGWNVLELEVDGLGLSDIPDFALTYLGPAGPASADLRSSAVRWKAIDGFSYWEGAFPSERLDVPFRWCVGSTSRIRIVLDAPAERLAFRIRAAAPHLEMEIRCDDHLYAHCDEFPARLAEEAVLIIKGPFERGTQQIQFDVPPPATGADRPITFILCGINV